ncbi:Hsp33 family molecular chaperone HslO [Paenibacillus athensensis]|uniref:33 kDa chaperonin n=1 Tax=Paenibacillus athensensis TaxID=1967502 RepID=A0A4Y8PX49_9BACL|nr:Hsp33 family molecular chaperone HslO [Paenibacillus athensensis]MCD1261867.1 Hsp33 family molecular chaperone HslO [Paenibacillus athensensis]
MNDYLIRGTAMEGRVRVLGVSSTGLTGELHRRHGTTPTAIAALGRSAAAALMMGAMLKGEEKLTVQIKGGGPIGQIVVDANAKGQVRGYVDNPGVDLPLNARGKLDVAGAVGTEGFLNIIKDLGLKDPYRGSVPIISGELAEDFTYYFAKSEQTPSVVALGVLVDLDYTIKAAGGIVIQVLPGLSDAEITQIESMVSYLASITSLLGSGQTLEEIIRHVLPAVQIMERTPVEFRCKCSRERVEQTLFSLDKTELRDMLAEDGHAEVVCHFCNETYRFDGDDLQQMIES